MSGQLTVERSTLRARGADTVAWRPDLSGRSAAVADLLPEEDVLELRPGQGMLVITRGPNTGAQLRLDRPVLTAGRHQFSDIYLDDITVSRRHAEFHCESGAFRVVDCGSRNNTYVNGQPVDSAVLSNHDEIQIGKYRLVFIGPTE